MNTSQLLKEYNETTNIYSKRSYGQLHYHVQDSINIAGKFQIRKFMLTWVLGRVCRNCIVLLCDVEVICIESKERNDNF